MRSPIPPLEDRDKVAPFPAGISIARSHTLRQIPGHEGIADAIASAKTRGEKRNAWRLIPKESRLGFEQDIHDWTCLHHHILSIKRVEERMGVKLTDGR